MTMKLLIIMKLADRSLKNHIYTLTLLKGIDEILIVRDTNGPEIEKVKYYCPPQWSLKFPILALFFKFLLMFFLSMRENTALIHAYLFFPHGILAFITGKLTRRKVGISLIAGPVELYDFGGSPVGKAYTKPLPKLSIKGKINLTILKRFDIVTATGNFTKKFLINKGIKEDKIFLLPHLVGDKFKPMNAQKEYDVVYIGRLALVKHVETLIKAICIVKEHNPYIRAVIVGDGPEKDKLEKLSKKLNLVKNIDFAGYQTDVWDWYNKSKLSVLTSEREGFPYSVVESLGCGVPVITSKCGDVCDVIKDGYNGVLINDNWDYHSFAEAITKLLQKPQIMTTYSVNALKTAEKMNAENAMHVWEDIIYKTKGEEPEI